VTIMHHLDDATILAFAAGTLGEAHGIVAAAHIAGCNHCRANWRTAESLGGEMLSAQDEVGVTDVCRAATLASLDLTLDSTTNKMPLNSDLPPAIARLLGEGGLSAINWHKKAPGIAVFDVPMSKGDKTHLKFLRIGTGRTMPEHGHGGEELTLILQGSYRDHMGQFKTGDVADLNEDVEHQPVVDSVEDCICVVAIEAPTKFKSIWARLAQPFIGI
jgi:putative transcriptional regulator